MKLILSSQLLLWLTSSHAFVSTPTFSRPSSVVLRMQDDGTPGHSSESQKIEMARMRLETTWNTPNSPTLHPIEPDAHPSMRRPMRHEHENFMQQPHEQNYMGQQQEMNGDAIEQRRMEEQMLKERLFQNPQRADFVQQPGLNRACRSCAGAGHTTCGFCGGTSQLYVSYSFGEFQDCPACNSGRHQCDGCHGTGMSMDGGNDGYFNPGQDGGYYNPNNNEGGGNINPEENGGFRLLP